MVSGTDWKITALYPLPFNGGSFRQSLLTSNFTAAFGLLLRSVFQQFGTPGFTNPRLSKVHPLLTSPHHRFAIIFYKPIDSCFCSSTGFSPQLQRELRLAVILKGFQPMARHLFWILIQLTFLYHCLYSVKLTPTITQGFYCVNYDFAIFFKGCIFLRAPYDRTQATDHFTCDVATFVQNNQWKVTPFERLKIIPEKYANLLHSLIIILTLFK